MLAWLAPILVFGLVVFVHELGHFIAAKIFGVYAPRFSIGFGPAIAKWRAGETEYRIGILPLGGYVRMASRLDESTAGLEGGTETAKDGEYQDPNAMVPFGPKPVPEDRWFESKPLAARLVIMLAGVTMNLVLGWVINVALAKSYLHDPTTRVEQVMAGKPASAGGMQPGDSVLAVNGRQVSEWKQVVDMVGASSGKPVTFSVLRGSAPVTLTVTPAADTVLDPETGETVVAGRIGVAAAQDTRSVPWGKAVAEGSRQTEAMATLVFTSLQKIATRQSSVSELGGPIAIAQSSVQAARAGTQVLFYLIALLSVNLAVFNLLPVPILDGGQIVVQIVEAIRGRPLSDRARENVARIGLALILLLFLTVTFNDLKRWIVSAMGGPAT
jgi:regulator of sigma E protease